MLEGIGLTPQDWSLAGLLAVVFLSVIFGWLVPKSTVKELIKDRNEWKSVALDLTATNHLLAEAAKENTEPAKTVAKVMTAAQDRLEEEGQIT